MSSLFYQTLSQTLLLNSVRLLMKQDATHFGLSYQNLFHNYYSKPLKS